MLARQFKTSIQDENLSDINNGNVAINISGAPLRFEMNGTRVSSQVVGYNCTRDVVMVE